jgi:ABC-type uncharacterized transport system permease subunit
VEAAIKVIRAVQIAMLVSVALFVGIGEAVGSIPKLNNPALLYALSTATITIVGVILVVRRWCCNRRRRWRRVPMTRPR